MFVTEFELGLKRVGFISLVEVHEVVLIDFKQIYSYKSENRSVDKMGYSSWLMMLFKFAIWAHIIDGLL